VTNDSFLNFNFPKVDVLQRFKSRKLLTSSEHIPVKVRWWNSSGS